MLSIPRHCYVLPTQLFPSSSTNGNNTRVAARLGEETSVAVLEPCLTSQEPVELKIFVPAKPRPAWLVPKSAGCAPSLAKQLERFPLPTRGAFPSGTCRKQDSINKAVPTVISDAQRANVEQMFLYLSKDNQNSKPQSDLIQRSLSSTAYAVGATVTKVTETNSNHQMENAVATTQSFMSFTMEQDSPITSPRGSWELYRDSTSERARLSRCGLVSIDSGHGPILDSFTQLNGIPSTAASMGNDRSLVTSFGASQCTLRPALPAPGGAIWI